MKGRNTLRNPAVTLFVILMLLLSFGMHSVQVSHTHIGHANQQGEHPPEKKSELPTAVGEYMHTSDKKLVFLVASALLLGIHFLSGTWSTALYVRAVAVAVILKRKREYAPATIDHIKLHLARGILNPKLH